MKHKIIHYISLGILTTGIATNSTLLVRYVPAVAESIYFVTTVLLVICLLAVFAGLISHTLTGSHDFMIKILAVLTPIGTVMGIGIILGAIN